MKRRERKQERKGKWKEKKLKVNWLKLPCPQNQNFCLRDGRHDEKLRPNGGYRTEGFVTAATEAAAETNDGNTTVSARRRTRQSLGPNTKTRLRQ